MIRFMKFAIKNTEGNIVRLGRQLGYRFLGTTENKEYSFVRSVLSGDYPRFHIYIKQDNSEIIFNLHLDQKKPSYKGSSAHGGEYEGELVEQEAQRIKQELGI